MITDSDPKNKISSNNNTVIAFQQKVFSRSFLGAFFVNREKIGEEEFTNDQEDYNRVIGLDYNLQSKDNKWVGKLWYHKSFETNNMTIIFQTALG